MTAMNYRSLRVAVLVALLLSLLSVRVGFSFLGAPTQSDKSRSRSSSGQDFPAESHQPNGEPSQETEDDQLMIMARRRVLALARSVTAGVKLNPNLDAQGDSNNSIPHRCMHVYLRPHPKRPTASTSPELGRNLTSESSSSSANYEDDLSPLTQLAMDDPGAAERILSVIKDNPEYDHYFFTPASAGVFVEEHFSLRHSEALDALASIVDRERYFRYLWLHAVGGITIDHRVTVKLPLRRFVRSRDLLLLFGASSSDKKKYSTAFIGAARNHTCLRWMTKLATKKITVRTNDCRECIVGGKAFSQAVKNYHWRSRRLPVVTTPGSRELKWVTRPKNPSSAEIIAVFPNDVRITRQIFKPLFPVLMGRGCRHLLQISHESNADVTIAPAMRKLVTVPSYIAPRRDLIETDAEGIIPKKILQISFLPQVPRGIWRAMETFVDLNPEYEYHYYSDASIRAYLTAHFDDRTVRAFDSLIPGAFKADLFRYCWLLREGGVYVDTDFVAIRPMQDVLGPNDTFVSAEDNGTGGVYNAIIACIAQHPLIISMLESALRRIENQRYGINVLTITGPLLASQTFRSLVGEAPRFGNFHLGGEGNKDNLTAEDEVSSNNTIKLLSFNANVYSTRCMIGQISGVEDLRDMRRVPSEQRFFWTTFPGFRPEMRWYAPTGNVHYHRLWLERQIYNMSTVPGQESQSSRYRKYAATHNLLSTPVDGTSPPIRVFAPRLLSNQTTAILATVALMMDRSLATSAVIAWRREGLSHKDIQEEVLSFSFGSPLRLATAAEINVTAVHGGGGGHPLLSCIRLIPSPESAALEESFHNPAVELLGADGDVVARFTHNEDIGDPVAFYDFRNTRLPERVSGNATALRNNSSLSTTATLVHGIRIHKTALPSEPTAIGEIEVLTGPHCDKRLPLVADAEPAMRAQNSLTALFFSALNSTLAPNRAATSSASTLGVDRCQLSEAPFASQFNLKSDFLFCAAMMRPPRRRTARRRVAAFVSGQWPHLAKTSMCRRPYCKTVRVKLTREDWEEQGALRSSSSSMINSSTASSSESHGAHHFSFVDDIRKVLDNNTVVDLLAIPVRTDARWDNVLADDVLYSALETGRLAQVVMGPFAVLRPEAAELAVSSNESLRLITTEEGADVAIGKWRRLLTVAEVASVKLVQGADGEHCALNDVHYHCAYAMTLVSKAALAKKVEY